MTRRQKLNKELNIRYKHIKERCNNPNHKSYSRYGGRGVKMCEEWSEDYDAFESWCFENGYQKNLAIDRIDNDGDYAPDNCRFVTLQENNQNRGTSRYYTIDGETKNLQQWCNFYGIKRGTVVTRLQHGWPIEDALTAPIHSNERDRTSYIGKRFGRLEVIDYAGDDAIGSDNGSRWVCRCDCGNTIITTSYRLSSGHTRSCGCLVSERARERMLSDDNPMKRR